jgi:hypothetical protein
MIEWNDTTRRIIGGLATAALLACAANYYLELHVFGRFDKAALVLSTSLMAVLAHAISANMPQERPKFSWWSFAAITAVMVGISALVSLRAYLRPDSGGLESLSFLVLPATVLIFLGRRWHLLRKELEDGTFSDERYHANPGQYMMGPLRHQLLWLIAAVALIGALAFVS